MGVLIMKGFRNIVTVLLLIALGFFMYNTKHINNTEDVKTHEASPEIKITTNHDFSNYYSSGNSAKLFPFNSSRRF
jgi:hypothetical protein